MRKILSIILTAVILLSAVSAFEVNAKAKRYVVGELYTAGDFKYEVMKDGNAKTRFYIGKSENVTIPAKLDGHKVTKIGGNTFNDCSTKIKQITVAANVRTIEDWSMNNETVKKIIIGPSVKKIEYYAFYSSSKSPEEICVDKNNHYFSSKDGVLYSKKKDKLIYYPSGKKGTDFKIPNTVKEISHHAFVYNRYLKKITFSKSVQTIGMEAFENCSALYSIKIPKTIKYVGDWSFAQCKNLSKIKIDANKRLIFGEGVFYNTNIKSITVPKLYKCRGITFGHCKNLKKITFSKSSKKIYKSDFIDCTFKKITIPSHIQEVGKNAFSGCNKLNQIIIESKNTIINTKAFGSIDHPAGSDRSVLNKDLVIMGKQNSTAQEYAENNGFKFVSI